MFFLHKTLRSNVHKLRAYCTATSPNFEEDFMKHHVPINFVQKTALTLGSAAISLLNPRRGDMIACLSETTGAN